MRSLLGMSAVATTLAFGCDRIADLPHAPVVADAGSAVTCCGCLCKDEHWSCSLETCVDEKGRAITLGPETGFLEVEQDYPQKEDPADSKIRGRVWYAFFPADEKPEDKPVAVFFQGGPGASVRILLGGNTGPRTLDRIRQDGEWVGPNPHSWTRFANLLYIETPLAGFSYLPGGQPKVSDQEPPISFSTDYDAATFVRVLLRFLARHPALEDNPVILVGESYGGVRATLMLHQVLAPEGLFDRNARYFDPALGRELQEHFVRVFGAPRGEVLKPEVIAQQFGHQVLIQPALLGDAQREQAPLLGTTAPRCLEECRTQAATTGDCLTRTGVECPNRTPSAGHRLEEFDEALRHPATHSQLLGVDMTRVAWHRADARRGSQQDESPCTPEPALAAELGELAPCHAYFRPGFIGGYFMGIGPLGDLPNAPLATSVLRNLKYVHTFITDAGEDTVVRSDGFATLFAQTPGVASATMEMRKGARELVVVLSPDEERTVRLPYYPDAGHAVSLYQPKELLDDVMSWYASTAQSGK